MPAATQMDIRTALKEGIAQLSAAHVPSHILAAELLLMHALGRDRTWLYSHPEDIVAPATAQKYFALVARRAAGDPTQYLTGKQEFWGLDFEVTPAVLIPRPETEHVIEVVLARLGSRRSTKASDAEYKLAKLRIADLGTGSGCIAITLARELPNAEIFATDISADALAVARRNAVRHAVDARVHLIECDLLGAFSESPLPFDLIVSNPPYVGRNEADELAREVRDHEPHAALFGGATGVEMYARLVEQAGALLRPGGILVLELGHNSLEHVRAIFEKQVGWRNVAITLDLAGIERVMAAERAL
jgi:release factor glutamine methyltransferase